MDDKAAQLQQEHARSGPDGEAERDALIGDLCARLRDPRRSHTELLVVDLLLAGIELHAPEYGPADHTTDMRDLTDELDAELGDGLFYILLRAVKRRALRLKNAGRVLR